jgi:hemin uptake protein HemP
MITQRPENKGAAEAEPGLSRGAQPLSAGDVRRIEIGQLLGASREAVLLHNGEAYRLRITTNNKLILTK